MSEQLLERSVSEHRDATCELYLVRHGTTTLNVQNRYRGRRDVPLDAQGYQDAVDAARLLSSRAIKAVYTGPLRRTIATAQIIADEARVPDLRILHGLNNVDYGAWEGLTAAEAAVYDPEAFELYRTDPGRAACPLGEKLRDAQERIIEAIHLIGERHSGEAVVAVTHAVMIRLVCARLSQASGELWRIPVGRGSYSRFLLRDGDLTLAEPPKGDDVD
jgi:broad specificity phosphatase PhoE